jgi:hypothetical protein
LSKIQLDRIVRVFNRSLKKDSSNWEILENEKT